jgi:hypothetical protein
MIQASNGKDTSSLLAYLINIDLLTPTEFEEMVGEALRRRCCSDCRTQITAGDKEKKKNPEALKKLKKTFQEWQMR